jgi:hypothetical protein
MSEMMKRTFSSVGACAVAAVVADALCLTYFASSFPAALAATGAVLVGCSVWPRSARRTGGRRRRCPLRLLPAVGETDCG